VYQGRGDAVDKAVQNKIDDLPRPTLAILLEAISKPCTRG
jgi:hypothetical protein